MVIVLQRVLSAKVSLKSGKSNSIGKGLLLLVGVHRLDTPETAKLTADKIARMRIFEDEDGKMNLDILSAGGSILSVPQFTLASDISKGNRPGFDTAAEPSKAFDLWRTLNHRLKSSNIDIKEGFFGKNMVVNLDNDGPVTFVLER
jgi:D-tyrosyl-tRNA(Tyr) deacylase